MIFMVQQIYPAYSLSLPDKKNGEQVLSQQLSDMSRTTPITAKDIQQTFNNNINVKTLNHPWQICFLINVFFCMLYTKIN